MVSFQPFRPSDSIKGHSSVDFLWVRVRVRGRTSSIHCEKTQYCRTPQGAADKSYDRGIKVYHFLAEAFPELRD